MAAKTGWHRYDTKLRQCHPVYTLLRPVVWVALCNRLQSSHLGDCSVLHAWRYASVVLAHVAWCLSVCLYVCHNFTSRCSVETPGWCELVFGIETSFDLSCTVSEGNLGISDNKGNSLWNFVPDSELWNFRHGTSIVAACCQLRWIKANAHCDKLATIFGRTKLTVLATVDVLPTTLASWLHWASISVYSAMYLSHCVAQVHLLFTVVRPAVPAHRCGRF